MKKIFLYGPPGSGKSSVGRELAEKLGLSFLDLDASIETKLGQSIAEFMSERGETAFRQVESETLKEALTGSEEVISLGGGTLLRDMNRAQVEAVGNVACLTGSLQTLIQRLHGEAERRPLLSGDLEEKLPALLEARSSHYESFPIWIQTDGKELADIAWDVQVALGRFRVTGMGAGYDVVVEAGGLKELGEALKVRGLEHPILVTDENVGRIYGEPARESLRCAGYEAKLLTIPAGESAKTLETVNRLWKEFLAADLDRKSTVVALGGGVLSDLAGFAAATFMRGAGWVVVPTTLLSMVDASLGGKTGFDLAEGKNLVGAFHPPRLVLADPEVLSTLPEAEFTSGLAEVVKHGIIADPELFELCAQGEEAIRANLPEVVRRAMAVKVGIIEEDPYERGRRAALNLGHTVGHAVEAASDYRLRHGEAVAIGMVVEARLAKRMGIATAGMAEEIAVPLAELGLPTAIPPNITREAVLRSMKMDKKKSSSVLKLALPVRIGEVEVGVAVEDADSILDEAFGVSHG